MAVTHTTTTAEPDDPTYDVSADAWNEAHTTADGSFVASKLAASATDRVFGRSTAGAGNGEEIPLTAAGRALIDDADAAAQRTTLGIAGAITGTKLDDLTAPDDNTDLNATTGAHGLLPKLGGGTTNYLRADGSWNAPAATELDYVQITSAVALTATTEGTAHTCITGTSQAYAAVPTLITVSTPSLETPTDAAGRAVFVLLYDGATLLGRIATVITPAAAQLRMPIVAQYRLTPTAATHQYIVKAYVSGGTGGFGAGSGGTGANLPAFLRITRV